MRMAPISASSRMKRNSTAGTRPGRPTGPSLFLNAGRTLIAITITTRFGGDPVRECPRLMSFFLEWTNPAQSSFRLREAEGAIPLSARHPFRGTKPRNAWLDRAVEREAAARPAIIFVMSHLEGPLQA